ncbi:MAG: aldehyde dehydrogenase family protein [Verrucomicrobiae bacterium]|nr:aldehyde dehydrogenase family protein [Verrucomicrobiae bacterium]
MQTYKNLIGGEWVGAGDGRTFETLDPSDIRQTVATYPSSGRIDVRQAFDAAAKAFPEWAALTPVARGRILSQASQGLASRKAALAERLTREEGKTLAEATGEVQRAIDIFRYYGALGYVLGGQTLPHDLPANLLYTRRDPLGVVALITPWNFPVAIPAWKAAPALLCGNTVVLKPASAAPALALELALALVEAGLPAGVLNVVTGQGRDFGEEVVAHPAVAAVSFTGSRQVGTGLHTALAPRMIRNQMEMGGKNPTLVLADADLDLAARLVATAGFGLTGQACTATSRVIVERPVLEAFTEKLVARARAVVVGSGLRDGVTMGPAVSQAQRDTDLDYVRIATDQGARVRFGGRRLDQGEHAHGWFLEPTVLDEVRPDTRLACEEVFGPVVGILAADDFDHAIALANGVEFGLSASVVTRDFAKALRYVDRIQAGVVKVNQISTGLALQAPFGGVKGSSTDSFREQGLAALDFYTRTRTVYLDYSA